MSVYIVGLHPVRYAVHRYHVTRLSRGAWRVVDTLTGRAIDQVPTLAHVAYAIPR